MDWLADVLQHASVSGEWEVGDMEAYVLNDAVVVVSMEDGKELKIKVCAGKPTYLDITTNLTKENEA